MILNEGQLLDERYEIEAMIGQGGMSYVYRAQDKKLGRIVALKVLKEEYCDDEEFILKFRNEAQAAARLNHPNIVAVYDVSDKPEEKLHYIVMELVSGITLKEYISSKGKLENREAIGIALQLIDGIDHAHRMGVVHRDIKPQNIIVGEEGTVKIADFGIARATSDQTFNASAMGSVHYISPEQARSGISDERSDIYSFGCTLYAMLSGKAPYDGDTAVSIVFAHMKQTIPHVRELVPSVYPALDMAVYKCMQKRPALRYQHIIEMGEDLRKAVDDPDGVFMGLDKEASANDIHIEGEAGSENVYQDGKGELNTGYLDEDFSEDKEFPLPESATSIKKTDSDPNAATNGNSDPVNSSDSLSVSQYENNGDSISSKIDIDIDDEGIQTAVESVPLRIRIFTVICLLLIIGLIIFVSYQTYSFFQKDDSFEKNIESSESESEVTTTVNITISALEARITEILGMTVDEANAYLAEYEVSVYVSDKQFSDTYHEGIIIAYEEKNSGKENSAKDNKDKEYQSGDRIPVTLSRGPALLTFYDEDNPDSLESLHDVSFEDIKKQLEERNISYEIENEYSETVVSGNIISISKSDTSNSSIPLIITVSKGSNEEYVKMPLLIGLSEEAARQILTMNGLVLGKTAYEFNENPEGTVIGQLYFEGTSLLKGSTVNIVISSGPAESSGEDETEDEGNSDSSETDEDDETEENSKSNAESKEGSSREIEETPESKDILEGSEKELIETGSENEGDSEGESGKQNEAIISEESGPRTWRSSINRSVSLGSGEPGNNDTKMISIRLRQDLEGESIYTTLQGARSYELGSEIQVIFSSIEGIPEVAYGTVEVVDAENDVVIAEFPCQFAPG